MCYAKALLITVLLFSPLTTCNAWDIFPTTRYLVRGDDIAPLAVWDDGRYTYFKFKADQPLPIILSFNGDIRRVERYMVTDGNVIVNGVAKRFEIVNKTNRATVLNTTLVTPNSFTVTDDNHD